MRKQLLIVDDDASLRNAISYYLISKGFHVCVADNVQNALKQMSNNKPDMVISDIMMPSMDGYDFLKMLRLNNSFFKIPIILLTAKGMTQDRIKGYNLGCNAYLTKPFDPDELLSIINNLFNNMSLLEVSPLIKNNSLSHILLEKNLTHRELTILNLVVKGYTNREIAKHLQVSIKNVEKYVSRLLNKTSTRNRTELAQQIAEAQAVLSEGE